MQFRNTKQFSIERFCKDKTHNQYSLTYNKLVYNVNHILFNSYNSNRSWYSSSSPKTSSKTSISSILFTVNISIRPSACNSQHNSNISISKIPLKYVWTCLYFYKKKRLTIYQRNSWMIQANIQNSLSNVQIF